MTEMREKIARAIYAVFLRGCCPHETATFDTDDEDVRVFCRAVADAVLALIEPVMDENEFLRTQAAEIQMNAFKWMEAHDNLKAGKPYDLPSPADLPNVMEENERLRGTLEKIVDHESNVSDDHTECMNCRDAFFDDYFEVRALARAALSPKSKKQDG
jgi:hypothetical protein